METNDAMARGVRSRLESRRVLALNLVSSPFEQARWAVIDKSDLLPYVPFDVEKAKAFALEVHPRLEFFLTSALTGEGMEAWYDSLRAAARGSKLVPAGAEQ